ncbi:MAG: hypothetical protein CVV49_06335 [Spirochaetae bacterium HGW-Spirochaetae-5]|nr:MAG: hypothetical protein CVV49_06335 [Spirochaetae bacterium HGW-Spirochaetae-5]
MNKINKIKYLMSVVCMLCTILPAEGQEVVLDASFFKTFNSRQIILRDDILSGLTNKVIIGRGKITSISASERYKKRYRIVIESSDSLLYNQKMVFFVFLENKDTVDLLSLESKFEFKGQLMGFTPLGTKRNEYILDVILMDGSTLIE